MHALAAANVQRRARELPTADLARNDVAVQRLTSTLTQFQSRNALADKATAGSGWKLSLSCSFIMFDPL